MQKFIFYFITKDQPTQVLRLKQSQQCSIHTSGSAVLSISAFIAQHFPKLRPPTLSPEIATPVILDQSSSKWQVSYCPFEQPWSNYLIDLTITDHARYIDNTFFIEIPLPQTPQSQKIDQLFTTVTLALEDKSIDDRLKKAFELPIIKKSGKKIGVVAYRSILKHPLDPRVNSVGLFLGNLFRNDSWAIFRIQDKGVPTVEELMTFDCVIMPGSAHSVCREIPEYITKTIENIFIAYKMNSNLKVIGTCFGHQAIAKHFGAKVQKLERFGGIQRITFDSNQLKQLRYFEDIIGIPQLLLSEHHQDFVMSVPNGFKHIASSNSCQYESFISNDHRILLTQFHSEYYCHFTKRYEYRQMHFCGQNELHRFYVPQSQQVESQNVQHSRLFLEVFRKFIND